MALIAVLAIPLLAALLCWVSPLRRGSWGITVASTWTVFALSAYVSAEVIASKRVVAVPGWFEADGLSALMLLLVSCCRRHGVRFRRRIHARTANTRRGGCGGSTATIICSPSRCWPCLHWRNRIWCGWR